MNRTIGELHVDSKILFDRLALMKKGEGISYQELSGLILKNVQREGYFNLSTAREMMRRENGIVFGVVRGKGIKALTDEQNVETSGQIALNKIRNASKKAVKKTTSCDYDSLSNEIKVKHNTQLGLFGALKVAASIKTMNRIESKVKETGGQISINKTLELFSQ